MAVHRRGGVVRPVGPRVRSSIVWRAFVLVVLTGCAFQPSGGGDPDGGAVGGDGPASDPDGATACTGAATWLDTCALPPPTAGLSLGASGTYTYDTDEGELRNPGDQRVEHTSVVVTTATGDVRVIVAADLTLAAQSTLRATGLLPLVIVTTGDLTIAGTLDVGRGGAGARRAGACGTSAGGTGADNSGGAGGGGGGGFGGAGATGSSGNSDGTPADPGKGGEAAALPDGPLGGCPGGAGGTGEDPPGSGGVGGGALYLVSSTVVRVTGTIDAGGTGGAGGTEDGGGNADAGGGGGGSGGGVSTDTPALMAPGIVVGNAGQPGQRAIVAALGGTGGSVSGSDGSAGGALASPDGAMASAAQPGGGGGGGGGAGIIIFRASSISVGATISPAPRP